jgi:tetratricopeptide (TPR) repeat protein
MRLISVASGLSLTMGVLLLSGCTGGSAGRDGLQAGFRALEMQQYDQALSHADNHLRHTPRGPGAAEALYLRGRVHEQRPAASSQQARRDYETARAAYSSALALTNAPALEANLRAGLANAAYWLEDYSTAATQWQMAYTRLPTTDAKAWTLYRIGLCQQRLGQFNQADATFATVQQRYRGTLAAQRAAERQGSRAFAVQLAVYSTPALADQTVASLQGQGAPVQRSVDSLGRQIVRVGPVSSYEQARLLRDRFVGSFPDAYIIP